MERARVFRTVGPIRILFGLTLPELAFMLIAGGITLQTVKAKFYIEFFALVLSLGLSFGLMRFAKQLFKPGAVKHFLKWISEDDHYTPLADPDNKPLVWRLQEEV